METKEAMLVHVSKGLEEKEGAHSANEIFSSDRTSVPVIVSVVPDHKVPEKAVRRRHHEFPTQKRGQVYDS